MHMGECSCTGINVLGSQPCTQEEQAVRQVYQRSCVRTSDPDSITTWVGVEKFSWYKRYV